MLLGPEKIRFSSLLFAVLVNTFLRLHVRPRLQNSGKVGNIEYGNFDFKKVYFKNSKFEFEFNFELDMGCGGGVCGVWGVGVTADDVRGCYDPVLPCFRGCYDPVLVVFLSKLNSNLLSLFVEITSFEVPVFDITLLYPKFAEKDNF
jgi:hypothetical protein